MAENNKQQSLPGGEAFLVVQAGSYERDGQQRWNMTVATLHREKLENGSTYTFYGDVVPGTISDKIAELMRTAAVAQGPLIVYLMMDFVAMGKGYRPVVKSMSVANADERRKALKDAMDMIA